MIRSDPQPVSRRTAAGTTCEADLGPPPTPALLAGSRQAGESPASPAAVPVWIIRSPLARLAGSRLRCVGLWLCGLLLAVGCASTNTTAFKPLASTTVEGRTTDEIGIATIAVFQKAGYEPTTVQRGSLSFQRRGSAMDNALYGGLLSNDVWERVRVRITPLEAGAHRVECDAFKVSSPGDQVFEEEHRVRSGGRFEELLKQVKARLN